MPQPYKSLMTDIYGNQETINLKNWNFDIDDEQKLTLEQGYNHYKNALWDKKMVDIKTLKSDQITLAKQLKIATYNCQGFNTNAAVKVQVFVDFIHCEKLDILVLTEVKTWKKDMEWQRKLKNLGIRTQVMTTPELARGGVVVLTKYENTKAKLIVQYGNTGGMIEIKYKTTKVSKRDFYYTNKIILFPVYINQAPIKQEKEWIQELMQMISYISTLTRHPVIVIGDFNTKGHKLMEKNSLKEITKDLLYTFQANIHGNLVRSKPDGIYTSGIGKNPQVYTKVMMQREMDHRAVIANIGTLVIEYVHKQHARKDIEELLEYNDEVLEEILNSEVPLISAEQIIAKHNKKKVTSLMQMKKIVEQAHQKNKDELQDIIKAQNKEFMDNIEAMMDEYENGDQREEVLFEVLKMIQGCVRNRKRGNGLHIVRAYEPQGEETTQGIYKTYYKLAGKYNMKFNLGQHTNVSPNSIALNKDKIEYVLREKINLQDEETLLNQFKQLIEEEEELGNFESIRKKIIGKYGKIGGKSTEEMRETYKQYKESVGEAIKKTAKKKAFGNDLVSPIIKNKRIKINECYCEIAELERISKISTRKVFDPNFDFNTQYVGKCCDHGKKRQVYQ
ncbi:UNKNOWN [Stylonychia lemnae]|uniref:Endonuclease/exonuclease/phosphatase domain-containing protein n=1 Tax=Stylonychia lemnae TaxID=5949 RepID=A0A078AH71_STYLE|nr:UNKNOWN [Stylonychia lemnae]|eukprot:CDW80862.1 UNKNOWN [Stylonychia lemnae]